MTTSNNLIFKYLENNRYEYLDSKDAQELLLKWYL